MAVAKLLSDSFAPGFVFDNPYFRLVWARVCVYVRVRVGRVRVVSMNMKGGKAEGRAG